MYKIKNFYVSATFKFALQIYYVAEGVGFEPTYRQGGIAFEAIAFDHSATPPKTLYPFLTVTSALKALPPLYLLICLSLLKAPPLVINSSL